MEPGGRLSVRTRPTDGSALTQAQDNPRMAIGEAHHHAGMRRRRYSLAQATRLLAQLPK